MSISKLTSATVHYPPVIKNDLLAIAARPMIAFSTIGSSPFHLQTSVQGENEVKSFQAEDIPTDMILSVRCMLKPCLFVMAEVRDESQQLISLNIGHFTARLDAQALGTLLSPLSQFFKCYGPSSHLWMAGMSQRLTHEALDKDVNILQDVFDELHLPFWHTGDGSDHPTFYREAAGEIRIISDIGLNLFEDLPDDGIPLTERWMMGLVGASITALASIQKAEKTLRQTTFFLPDSDPIVVEYGRPE